MRADMQTCRHVYLDNLLELVTQSLQIFLVPLQFFERNGAPVTNYRNQNVTLYIIYSDKIILTFILAVGDRNSYVFFPNL